MFATARHLNERLFAPFPDTRFFVRRQIDREAHTPGTGSCSQHLLGRRRYVSFHIVRRPRRRRELFRMTGKQLRSVRHRRAARSAHLRRVAIVAAAERNQVLAPHDGILRSPSLPRATD